jgi:predicted secreted protein
MLLQLHARIYKTFIVMCLLSQFVPSAFAAESSSYDRVQLSAQAVAEAENDTLVAVMSAQRKGENYARLADEVNRLVSQSLTQARQYKAVEVQTLDYQTRPVYEKNHQSGWVVSQSIQLKSRDSAVLGKLLGQLQDRLMLDGISYAVSPEQQQRVQEGLITRAIAAFEKRAQNITHALHRKRYRLVSMHVNTGGITQRPVPMQSVATFKAARSPTAIEAGKQQITVTVCRINQAALPMVMASGTSLSMPLFTSKI